MEWNWVEVRGFASEFGEVRRSKISHKRRSNALGAPSLVHVLSLFSLLVLCDDEPFLFFVLLPPFLPPFSAPWLVLPSLLFSN